MTEEITVTACPVLSVHLTSEDLEASVLTMTFVPLTVVVAAPPVVAVDDDAVGGYRLHRPSGRRDRHHEHDAGHGFGTHHGNRPA